MQNALEMIFFCENALDIILLLKYFGNGFTIKIHKKLFYFENVLRMILQLKCIRNSFPIKCIGNWVLWHINPCGLFIAKIC